MILLCRGQKTLFTSHTTLFTHLKIILLQCFQFSVFNFSNNKFNPNGPLVGFADPFSFLHRFPSPSSKTKNKIPTISELRTSVRNLLLSHSSLYLQWSKKLNHCFEVRFFSSFFIFSLFLFSFAHNKIHCISSLLLLSNALKVEKWETSLVELGPEKLKTENFNWERDLRPEAEGETIKKMKKDEKKRTSKQWLSFLDHWR